MSTNPRPLRTPMIAADRDGRLVQGTLLASRLRFLRSRGGDVLERALGRLGAEDAAALRGLVLPSSWYSAELLERLETASAAVVANGDPRRLFLEMGRFTAETNLSPRGVQRAYVREQDPHFLLANVPRMYVTQHTDGDRTYEKTADRAAIIRSYAAQPSRAEDCLTTLGWMGRAIEWSGGRDVRVEERLCRSMGAPHCEFHCSWR